MSPAPQPSPSPVDHLPGSAKRGSAVWIYTKRFLMGVILIGLIAPFAAAAALWLEAHRGTQLASGISRLQAHFEPSTGGSTARTETQVDARVGRLPLLLGRMILRATPAPPEAKLALGVLREAQVSVWTGSHERTEERRLESMDSLDRDMALNHWDRVAHIRDGHDEVIVYLDRFQTTDRELSICVAVVEPGTRVIAGGKLHPNALADLVRLAQARHGGKLPHFALR